MELTPDKLLPGMFVSEDVRTGTGFLLLNGGVAVEKSISISFKDVIISIPQRQRVYVRGDKRRKWGSMV